MSQELEKRHSRQEEKRLHRHKMMGIFGMFLITLGLCSLRVSLYVRSIPSIFLAENVPSIIHMPYVGFGSGGDNLQPCFSQPFNQYIPQMKELPFTLLQKQSAPAIQTVTFTSARCTQPVSWSSDIMMNQGARWLSISPTRGDLKLNTTQAVSVIVSSRNLAEGVYTGDIAIRQHPEAYFPLYIHVIVHVVKDQQQALIKDIVAFAYIHDLTLMAQWPANLVKDQPANITVSLLPSRSLPSYLPTSTTKSTNNPYESEQYAVVPPLPNVQSSTDDEGPFGAFSGTLLVDADGGDTTPPPPLISLVARLQGAAFDVLSPISLPQDPYQRIVSFHWSILPKEAGYLNLTVAIAGLWPSQSSNQVGTEPDMRTFISSAFTVSVDTSPTSLFSLGQIRLIDLFDLLVPIGIAISTPWVNDQFKKRKRRGAHPPSVSPQRTLPQQAKKPRRRNRRGPRRRN